jgi:trehalose 6-phosphate phosphatase
MIGGNEKIFESELESLLSAVSRAPRALLMLDYDGTLAPFRKERAQAFPYAGVSAMLQEIILNGRTRVVIVSGRDAEEIIPLLNVGPRPEVWGLHGLQRLTTNGSAELRPLDQHTGRALAAAEEWLRYQRLQHLGEVKKGSIALHWRGLNEREVKDVRKRALVGWTVLTERSNLDLLPFDGGIEIRSSSVDKGDAVRKIASEMEAGIPAAYLGDDVTDEPAFEAMSGRGLSILVRPQWRETAARLWLQPPDEVLDLLARWLRACQGLNAQGKEENVAVKA